MNLPNPYTFKATPSGMIEVYEKGSRIGTGTESFAAKYGYTPTPTREGEKSVEGANTNISALGTSFGRPNSLGITSSAQVQQANTSKTATTRAAEALTGNEGSSSTNPFGTGEIFDDLKKYIDEKTKTTEGASDRALKAVELSYNSALARKSNDYERSRKELQENFKKDIDVARANAIALNPYATTKGSQTASNFASLITDKYASRAADLASQYELAVNELEAGRYESYAKIVNSIESSNVAFQKEMFDFKTNLIKSAEQSRQFEATLQTKYSDDYRSHLTQVPYSPEEIVKMTDEELMNTTAGRLAQKAGINDPNAVRTDMTEGSYKSQSLEISQAKEDRAAEMQNYQIQNLLSLIGSREAKMLEEEIGNEPNFEKAIVLKKGGNQGTDIIWIPNKKISNAQEKGKDLVLNGLNTINQLEAAYITATGGDENWKITSLLQGVGRSTKLDTAWEAYLALRDANATVIAKGIKMESGAPSNADVDRAKSGTPSQWSSTYKAKQDFESMREQLRANLSGFGTFKTPQELNIDSSKLSGGTLGNRIIDGKNSDGSLNRAGI